MNNIYNRINELLQKEDIEGLLEFGAPNDEYSSEAMEIASLISSIDKNRLTEDIIISLISDVWSKYFDPFSEDGIKKT